MPLTQTISWTATWVLSILVFLLILWRPGRVPEYVWAAGGAGLLVALHLLAPGKAWTAVKAGTSVYLFLAGMMLLAELARQHGVFDWLAAIALERARGSQLRLFTLVYLIGIVVTALLSNDATAVLLTPAVLAVVRRTRTSPLPYLFTCAFVANAAGFLLPISNPANLVVFEGGLPTLGQWMHLFLLPASCALLITFFLLWWRSRKDLRMPLDDGIKPPSLNTMGRRAGIGVLLAAAALLTTSAMGGRVGAVAAISGVAVMLFVAGTNGRIMLAALRKMSWKILPLVAGLFVIVEALNGVGALPLTVHALKAAASWPAAVGLPAIAAGVGILANIINNLPAGLLGAAAVNAAHGSAGMHAAVLLGIDLGPNLYVTGSLATILWMMALRRENIPMNGWRFLRMGILIMPCTLIVAALALVLVLR
jgi:arsenical pump membrane protein